MKKQSQKPIKNEKVEVEIAYRPYSVKEQVRVIGEEGHSCYGLTKIDKAEIIIEKGLGTKHNNTLLHELMHAILSESGAGCMIEDEELFVRIVTPHLLNVIEQIIEKKMLK